MEKTPCYRVWSPKRGVDPGLDLALAAWEEFMAMPKPGQATVPSAAAAGSESVIPNPKLKLLDQVREVMRLKHYSIRTERTYCDWARRYVQFHHMLLREEMFPAEPKMEGFLSHLAVDGNVAVS